MSTVLEADKIRFLSEQDEAAFFGWLDRIAAVRGVEGTGTLVRIAVDEAVDDDSLRELVALFHRYGVASASLAQFRCPANEAWFARPSAYWFASVFGPSRDHG